MKSMNRQFGKIMVKGAGNQASVAVILSDYEECNKMLEKLIEASKAWRDAWVNILNIQTLHVGAFEEIYNPIVGATSDRREAYMTPREQVQRTALLKGVYAELKTELLDEVAMMDSRIIKPATEVKDYLHPIKKTIKKRDNKRLDWERYIDKVNGYNKKSKKTDKDIVALQKAEQDCAEAAVAFKDSDEHLRETLPPLVHAAFSVLPHLLAVQILIQNTVLAQYYTSLHNYCEESGYPSPPPPMDDVIAVWQQDFKPIQQEVESINCIARGKAVHQPMTLEKGSSMTGMNIRNGIQSRKISQPEGRIMRAPSSNSLAVVSPPAHSSSPEPPSYLSNRTSPSRSPQLNALGKKKPPPPPPKRIGSSYLYAIALYAFEGQGPGDLSFKEGDQIKVVKKTDSTDDWWEGELRGKKGSFPANYCKLG